MTKKHFIALADIVRATKPQTPCEGGLAMSIQWQSMRDAIADFCRMQNPNFMYSRWISYIDGECGPNGGAVKKTL